ncbi:putative secreted beta-glucosidase [Golovinomyces cichoracearum]|uniref:Putative secreted beta-glucosidase n=1 Tax=Golovinomyces cichoracearum TaxID=62708 RepID=A0A420ING5_9PEZI|nr:putative secreted beta-glucosidase [Golovinomyces cichoracearum]
MFSRNYTTMKFSCITLLAITTLALAQPHNHLHHHHTRHSSSILERDEASAAQIEDAVVTVYELDGQKISHDEVESCLDESKCVVVGNQISSASTDTTTAKSAVHNLTSNTIADSERPIPAASVSPQALSELSSKPSSVKSDSPVKNDSEAIKNFVDPPKPNNLAKLKLNFPSGKIDCSHFPSEFGAVSADWIGHGGWTGVQKTPGYSLSSKVISYIETATPGEGCTPGSFCSYSCPAGYQKSQWPDAQGSSGQSIGGLYCNSEGKLELSRTASRQLCTPGVGDINVKNSHHKNVAICRTDYPGTEAETVALDALPGSTVKVTCPDAKEYYRTWEGAPTSAQYYINPSGYDIKDACTWGTPGSNIGNWAPVNMGVGKGDSGSTFVSLFPNTPTNPDGVLDFNIEITGDVTGQCAYRNGNYYRDGVISPTGCTVGVNGIAVFEFS